MWHCSVSLREAYPISHAQIEYTESPTSKQGLSEGTQIGWKPETDLGWDYVLLWAVKRLFEPPSWASGWCWYDLRLAGHADYAETVRPGSHALCDMREALLGHKISTCLYSGWGLVKGDSFFSFLSWIGCCGLRFGLRSCFLQPLVVLVWENCSWIKLPGFAFFLFFKSSVCVYHDMCDMYREGRR